MRKLDQIGLGWRPELAPSIFNNLGEIDLVEVIIDDFFNAPKEDLRALKTLEAHVPVIYHGVSLGLASSFPVCEKRLHKLAKVFDYLNPKVWSEHLAFVRAGGIEIGHLAAPPRTPATQEGALENIHRIEKIVGSPPILENIATLIDPPGSSMSESKWVSSIIRQSRSGMLLDLHNLFANSINFKFNPIEYIHQLPLNNIELVHLSGGKWIPEPKILSSAINSKRLLDDHIHDVPSEVFDLLFYLAKLCPQPLRVIIERDGNYPSFDILLKQIRKARHTLERARSQSLVASQKISEISL